MKTNILGVANGFGRSPGTKDPGVTPKTQQTGRENTAKVFDEDYLAKLRRGDDETAAHFDRYFRRFLRLKLWGKFSRQREEDLIDSVMSAALGRIMKGEPREAASLPGYVGGVCLNLMRQAMRPSFNREGVDTEIIQIADGAKSAETILLERERAAAVQKVLRSLGSRDRDVLMDVFYHEVSRGEVCRKYGVTAEQLRLILFRARKKFQGLWKAERD